MNEQSGYQVSGDAAQRYEQYATRYYMGPWVADLIGLADLRSGERVLDLACGTGVVARQAAAQVGATGQVTGLDFNAGMLAVARATPPLPGTTICWVEGSAMAMDFPDASFDVILCQQGIQFFPDRLASLREMHRVLVPGGRALLSVWRSASPYNIAVGEALERYVGAETATKYCASRVVPDAEELRRLIGASGFRAVQVRPRAMTLHLPAVETFVLGHLSSSPVAAALAALSAERRAEFAKQVKLALQPFAEGDGVAVPDEVNIAIAHKRNSNQTDGHACAHETSLTLCGTDGETSPDKMDTST
jgi:ubiquinone/menaquinone biosynthesis C-methylase UbiE